MTELKHAEIICHMAKHGFESVAGRPDSLHAFRIADRSCNPMTYPDWAWRIKPTTITYTVTVPEPMRVMPKALETYWYLDCGVCSATQRGYEVDILRFNAGNIWDTEAKAQQAFDALFGPLKGKA
jgi:hypothetical protein